MRTAIQPIIVSLATIGLLGVGAYFLFAAFIDKLNSISGDLGKTLVTAAVTTLVAVLTLVLGKIWDTKIKITHDIREKKIPVYEDVLTLFFDVLMADKTGKPKPTEQEMLARFTDFTRRLTTWGSSEVIRTWIAFRNHPWTASDPTASDPTAELERMEAVLMAIRKDVGNEVSSLKSHELMKLFINDLDKHYAKNSISNPSS
jgi:hypothetical protein